MQWVTCSRSRAPTGCRRKPSGVVSDHRTTASNQPADIGFVTVVHLRHGVQPLAGKRKRTPNGSPSARGAHETAVRGSWSPGRLPILRPYVPTQDRPAEWTI